MGASSRRAGRGLKQAPVLAGEVGSRDSSFLIPAIGLFYAVTLGIIAIAVDQLVTQVEGPWFNLLGGAVLLVALATTWLLLRTGWRRHREALDRRAALWGAGAIATVLLSLVTVYALVETASFNSVISGADVHLTRPILDSLPRPPGAKLLDERPGLAGTESMSGDFSSNDLAGVIPFYTTALEASGWLADSSTAGTGGAGFFKGLYRITVVPDQPTGQGDFSVIVDHLTQDLTGSPSPSATASP